jgi:hypothetical protein
MDEERFIDGSLSRNLIWRLATIRELSMKFREWQQATGDLPTESNVFRFYDLQLRKIAKRVALVVLFVGAWQFSGQPRPPGFTP